MNLPLLLNRVNNRRRRVIERVGALHDLATALARGELMPVGDPGEIMHPQLTAEAMELGQDQGELEVFQAVQVALVNGDLSALRGMGWHEEDEQDARGRWY